MPFIKNIWYVAAWASDLEEDKPLGCVIAGEPIVIWRNSSGDLIAMEDRCPHRHAPLSMGRIEGDDIRCMYHGLKFSQEGKCIHVPGSDTIPPKCEVRRYAVTQKDDWLWVWRGDARKADDAAIPTAFGLNNDIYIGGPGGQLDYDANYELVNDNLTDLSHLDFVHETTLGAITGQHFSKDAPEVKQIENGLLIQRWLTTPLNPDPAQPAPEAWNEYRYLMPGFFLQEVFIYPPGTAERCNYEKPPAGIEPIFARWDQQAVTPMTEKTTRYFFAAGVQKKYIANAPPAEVMAKIIDDAFDEDHAMINAQQRIWDLTSQDQPKAFLHNDKAPHLFRRLIAKRLEEEAKVTEPASV